MSLACPTSNNLTAMADLRVRLAELPVPLKSRADRPGLREKQDSDPDGFGLGPEPGYRSRPGAAGGVSKSLLPMTLARPARQAGTVTSIYRAESDQLESSTRT